MSTSLHTAIARLDDLGSISDSPTFLVRTFLSSASLQAAGKILQWMVALGMEISHAPDGTVRGILAGSDPAAAPLLLGSHLDTVIDAGKYDGALGITVGKIHVHPIRGASNSIPQSATFTIDLRHPDDSTRRESLGLPHESLLQIAAERSPDLEWDWAVGKGKPFHYYAFGAAVSEVEIDGFTGMSHVRRVDILHDVGDSLNPAIDRGQIEGGFVQGMGWLTSEELKWDDSGKLLTHSASTYAIPAYSDAPPDFRVALLTDAKQPNSIHGSKAVGEPPLMLAISVREAIRDAIRSFEPETDFILPSPCTGEAVKSLIRQ